MLSSYPGVRISRVVFYDGNSNYSDGSTLDASTNPTLWRYADGYGAVGGGLDTTYSTQLNLPKSAAFSWTASYSGKSTTTQPSAIPSWWCAERTPYNSVVSCICNAATCSSQQLAKYSLTQTDYQVTYNITTNAPSNLRRTFGAGGAALLSIASETPGVVIRAPAAPPTSLLLPGFDQKLAAPRNIGAEVLLSSKPGRWSYQAIETQSGTTYNELPTPSGATALNPARSLFFVNDPGSPYCLPDLNVTAPPPAIDPSNLAYSQIAVNYPGQRPMSHYYNVNLKCRDMLAPMFKQDSGTQTNASATALTTASVALRNFIDSEITANWGSSGGTAPSETTHFNLNGATAHAGAQIISNGLYYNALYSHAETASLAQNTPVADYTHLSSLLDYIDPNGTGAIGINAATQAKVRTLAATLDPSFTGVPLNALGLPYGNFAAPWAPVWTQSQPPPLALSDVTTRWNALSQQQTQLQTVLSGQKDLALLSSSIQYMQAMAIALQSYANSMSTKHTASFTAQSNAEQLLNDSLSKLMTNEKTYVQTLCNLRNVTFDPNDIPGSMKNVASVEAKAAQDILDACAAAADGSLGWLKDIAKAIPYVSAGLSAITTFSDALDTEGRGDNGFFHIFSLVTGGFEDPSKYKAAAEKIKNVAKVAEIAGTLADYVGKADSALDEITPFLEKTAGAQNDCDSSTDAYKNAHQILVDVATQNTLLDTMSVQASTVQSLMKGIQATLEYLVAEGTTNLQLASDVDYTNPNNSNAAILGLNTTGSAIAASLDTRAKFIQAACYTVRSAVREASKDLYGVSGMLQTSAGRSQVQPGLLIPAEDVTFNQSPPSSDNASYHYVTNIWDSTGFSSAFDQSGNPNLTSYIEAASSRFSDLVLTEMCRTIGTDVRPSTLFVVRHVLTSQELTNLTTLGYTDFSVGLRELAESASSSIDMQLAGVAALDSQSLTWDVPLAAPVVLGARYATCADSACTIASTVSLGNVPIDLIHSRDAWVPRTCASGEAPDQTAIFGKGVGLPNLSYKVVVDTCRQQVSAPPVHQDLNFLDAVANNSMLLQLNSVLKGSTQLCHSLPSNALLDGVQGMPLMGTWTVGSQLLLPQLQNLWTAQTLNPQPISLPAGLQGLEVLFFVGAEPKPQSAPAAYVTSNL